MQIKNDLTIEIATANSRRALSWKNKKIQWSELLDRLSNCIKTSETMAEYSRMSRDRQSDIKDVGGFVGGYCKNGIRRDTTSRSLVTLDADFDDGNVWSDYELIYTNAAAVYSTHKHKPTAPRLRLVIPLNREVTPDEYQAIARRIAENLGIDKFDDTTYQPQRLMFWPSSSYDGEFFFDKQDGPILDADEVLATYKDWTDMSAWPVSSKVAELVHKSAEKQKDPLTKEGLVGVFCRTYSIEEAIEKFIPEYIPAGEGRYTYEGGSTAAGVVIYDNKFSYSHHSTDPTSCQLCNAWDLVRLHKFGDLDERAGEDTPATKLPSYKAMSELAASDERVKIALIREKSEAVSGDFDILEDDAQDEPKKDWEAELSITNQGAIASTIDNIAIILTNDKQLRGRLAINQFEHTLVTLADLPWRKLEGPERRTGSSWNDNDDANLRHYLERAYGISSKDKIFDAVNVVAEKNSFHPVKDYLESCEWDGVPRVEEVFIRYLGAADTPYTRAITRKTLTAAVARILEPAIKFDYMLTIKGAQGLGKSSLIAKLAGEWFSDTFSTVQGKEAFESIQGRWIIEVGELAGIRKAEVEAVKLFISKQSDRFRPAYGRRPVNFPRQCIFIATTNEQQFLKDSTGNRRYWVIDTPNQPTGDFWRELTPDVVRLIWGEAIELYKKREPLYLSKEMEEQARKIQEAYTEEDAQAGLVEDYLERRLPADWDERDLYERRSFLASDEEGSIRRQYACNIEVWAEALGGDPNKLDRLAIKRIQSIMAEMDGWTYSAEQKRSFRLYGRQRYYMRG